MPCHLFVPGHYQKHTWINMNSTKRTELQFHENASQMSAGMCSHVFYLPVVMQSTIHPPLLLSIRLTNFRREHFFTTERPVVSNKNIDPLSDYIFWVIGNDCNFFFRVSQVNIMESVMFFWVLGHAIPDDIISRAITFILENSPIISRTCSRNQVTYYVNFILPITR